jgi:hypothetical protein
MERTPVKSNATAIQSVPAEAMVNLSALDFFSEREQALSDKEKEAKDLKEKILQIKKGILGQEQNQKLEEKKTIRLFKEGYSI